MRANRNLILVTVTFVVAIVVSGIKPVERGTWWLEVAPIAIVLPVLWFTARRFPLTSLLYALIAVHGVVLAYGGHYTYERTPLGDWAQEAFGFARNHYDRFGHFMQGFVPAIAAREVLLRTSPLRPGGWLFFLVLCVCVAISAFYELVEFAAYLISGESAESFLGTQGDVWDAHWDITFALVGCVVALSALGRFHDRHLANHLEQLEAGASQ